MLNVEKASPDLSEAKKIRIGAATLDVRKNQVSVAGVTSQIEPRLVRVLLALCENAGEVVRREDLLSVVSTLPYAGDESLTQAISKLRTVLGDKSKTPGYIKTIPRQGYLLVAPVNAVDAPHKEIVSYASRYPKQLLISAIIVLLASIAIWTALWPEYNPEIELIEKKDIEFIERETK